MKTLGLLGGVSWPSTPLYYAHLNRMAAAALGGHHSAELIIYSIDYHEIKSRYAAPNGWREIPDLLARRLARLAAMGPEAILVCNNTLHKAIEILREEDRLPAGVPVIDLVDAVGACAREKELYSLLLLGTKFTMEDGFFARRLIDGYGLDVVTPDEDDRQSIQEMQSEIAAGRMRDEFFDQFTEIISRYEEEFDGVVLACTELPLTVDPERLSLPVLDTIEIHCTKGIRFALEREDQP